MQHIKWPSRLSNKWFLLPVFLLLLSVALVQANETAAADPLRPNSDSPPGEVTDSLGMKDCTNTSTGFVPLTNMARAAYQGFPGGLYFSSNAIPKEHLEFGMAASQGIQRLGKQGEPDSAGKIVLLSLGMSNSKREFGTFIDLARGETAPGVALVNGSQGGYDAARIADPGSDYWTKIDDVLTKRNLTPPQVQAVWIKQAVARETDPFPQSAQELQSYLRDIVLIVEERFPNAKTVYFSSRTYGGYGAPDSTSPEPWAYEGGFAVKWLIEAQMTGSDAELAYANTPWLAWGPYLWADGLNARSDGLIWACEDFEDDGIHPSPSGELKVANLLLDFFNNNLTTQWFPRN
jgi:hypothetical protein